MVTDTTPQASDALRIARCIGYLIAALFLIAAVYYYFVPAQIPSAQGVFGCGTAGDQPTDGFAKGACQGTAQIFLFRTIAFAVAAVITAAGTYLLLRDPVDEEDEDIELSGESRSRRGGRAAAALGSSRRRPEREGDLDRDGSDDWDNPEHRRSPGRSSVFDDEPGDELPDRRRGRDY